MAETLGSLCDKLTIVKLKQWHSEDNDRLENLNKQSVQLQNEIDEFITDAVSGKIPFDRLHFSSNKVFKKEGNQIKTVFGSIGGVFAELAQTNCDLWHEQEKVYDFEQVPVDEKNQVVKKLAHLNLIRNKCIDLIDTRFKEFIEKLKK